MTQHDTKINCVELLNIMILNKIVNYNTLF